MIDKPNVYNITPGEYIEDKDLEALAEKYIGSDPLIADYEARVYETEGSKKNHLYFTYQLIPFEEIRDNHSLEEHEQTNKNINKFLEAVTGRTAEQRKEDID